MVPKKEEKHWRNIKWKLNQLSMAKHVLKSSLWLKKLLWKKNLQGHKVADRDSKRVSQSYHCDMEIPQLMYVWIQSTRKEFVLIIIY